MLTKAMFHPSAQARRAVRFHGFTLIELLVGITILALVLALAAPGFSDAINNSYIRSVAESMQNGLQFARGEAVRRNTPVRFHLVNRLTAGCALSASGPSWIVNLAPGGNFVSPAGSVCASAISDSTSPYILQTSANSVSNKASASTVVDGNGVSSLAFDGLGQLMVSTTPTTAVARTMIDVKSSGGTCLLSGGSVRCLRVVVDPGGQVRLCDPNLSSNSATSLAC